MANSVELTKNKIDDSKNSVNELIKVKQEVIDTPSTSNSNINQKNNYAQKTKPMQIRQSALVLNSNIFRTQIFWIFCLSIAFLVLLFRRLLN